MPLLGWGPHIFTAPDLTFDQISRRVGGRWADHEIIGRSPAGQYIGPASDMLRLHAIAFPIADGPSVAARIRAMQQDARAGRVYNLISGDGDVLDPMRIEHIETEESIHDALGAAGRVAFTIEFKFQDDGPGQIWSVWP